MGRGDVGSAGLSAVAAPSCGPAAGCPSWHGVSAAVLRTDLIGVVTTSGGAVVEGGLRTGGEERLAPPSGRPSRRLRGLAFVRSSLLALTGRASRGTPLRPYSCCVTGC
jgi:hypothetical protein